MICDEDAVELAHQVAANRLRRRVNHRGRRGREADRGGQRAADLGTTRHRRTEGRRSIVVGGGDRQLTGRVQRRVEVIGQQRGIELVERLDRAVGAVAEGDVDRRTAVEGGEGQGLAGETASRRRAARGERGRGAGVAVEAERRERVAGADDRRSATVPVEICSEPPEGSSAIWPEATPLSRHRWRSVAVRTPVARSIADSISVSVAALQEDRRVAVAVGDEVAADARARRDRTPPGRRGDSRT